MYIILISLSRYIHWWLVTVFDNNDESSSPEPGGTSIGNHYLVFTMNYLYSIFISKIKANKAIVNKIFKQRITTVFVRYVTLVFIIVFNDIYIIDMTSRWLNIDKTWIWYPKSFINITKTLNKYAEYYLITFRARFISVNYIYLPM